MNKDFKDLRYFFKRIKDFWYNIKFFCRNFWNYKSFLWNNNWFDSAYIFEMLKKKLQIDIKYYKKYGYGLYSYKLTNQMELCIKILNRIIDDDYISNAFVHHDKKWGDISLDIEKEGKLILSRNKVITKDEEKQERAESSKLHKHSDYMKKQDIGYLFKNMNKHILSWWD